MIPWEDPFSQSKNEPKKSRSKSSGQGGDILGGGLSVLVDGLKVLGPLLLSGLRVLVEALWWGLTLLFRETHKICKHFHQENQGHMSSVISQLLIVSLFAFGLGYVLGVLR